MTDLEPYAAVAALFDGDLALTRPWWAARQDWVVVVLPGRLALCYYPTGANR